MNTKEMKAFSSLRCIKEKVNIAYLLALGNETVQIRGVLSG